MEEKEIDGHVEKYKAIKPNYEVLTSEVERLLRRLLEKHKLKFHAIESRTKDIESFKGKLNKKERNYRNPFDEITDLSGIRIITYYQDDVEKIEDIIKKEFKVDHKNSMDKSKLLNPNEFGYLSVHYVVSLSKSRGDLEEWIDLKNHKCEIQIRTVLQHSWASISHALQYKNKEDVPSKLQRKLFRLAGLFELADEQFLEIRDNHEKEKTKISHIKNIEKSDSEINYLTMQKFISQSTLVENIFKKAIESGFSDAHENPYEFSDVDVDEFGLSVSKQDDPLISEIVKLTNYLNITSIKELNELLMKNISHSPLYFINLKKANHNRSWHTDRPFTLMLFLILSNIDKLDSKYLVTSLDFDQSIADRIITVASQLKS